QSIRLGAWAVETQAAAARGFGQLFRSFSLNSYGYSPQMIEKSALKPLCLAHLVPTAQAPSLMDWDHSALNGSGRTVKVTNELVQSHGSGQSGADSRHAFRAYAQAACVQLR
ncbi:MAG: hypothetical protein WCD36_14570, partial [Rhodanobacteraceae bacterium]